MAVNTNNERAIEETVVGGGLGPLVTYFPHQSSFSVVSSLTTRLSLGARPVFAPESVAKAPLDVMNDPCSYFMACSYNSAPKLME